MKNSFLAVLIPQWIRHSNGMVSIHIKGGQNRNQASKTGFSLKPYSEQFGGYLKL